jgi:hypothetical protein
MAAKSRWSPTRGAWTAFLGALWPLLAASDPASAQVSDPETQPHALIATLLAARPHPALSRDARLFDPFVGVWDCEFSFRSTDGTARRLSGEVTFGWIIDGRAIQDTWITYPKGGTGERNIGTSIRFFDDSAKTWRVVFVSPQFRALTTLEGGMEGDRIVLRGRDTDGALLRWSFNDIRPDSFLWRGEISRDGGRTWHLEEEHRMTRRVSG